MTDYIAEQFIDTVVAERDTARAEAADLRRQLAKEREEWRQLAQDTQYYIQDAADLRQQLAEAQAEIAAVPRFEIAELCDLIETSTTAISLDCTAGWAVREWLETYDSPSPGKGDA